VRWFRRSRSGRSGPGAGSAAGTRKDPAAEAATHPADARLEVVPFVCSTCGRTDLPPAGDWDPPICLECDAAINFDALEEADAFDGY
jgi:hypothetical protein